MSVSPGAGRENGFYSHGATTPPVLLTAPVILLGYRMVTLPLSGPGDAREGPTVVRPLLLKPSSEDKKLNLNHLGVWASRLCDFLSGWFGISVMLK